MSDKSGTLLQLQSKIDEGTILLQDDTEYVVQSASSTSLITKMVVNTFPSIKLDPIVTEFAWDDPRTFVVLGKQTAQQ